MRTKTLERFVEENDKNCFRLDWSRKIVREVFEKVWIVWRTRERTLFKTFTDRILIGRNLASIDQKLNSINWAPIELSRFKPKFLSQFRLVEQQIRSIENLENLNFWKQSNFMQKLLKAQYFMNEMHEYEIKSFSKTLEFNPNLPKTIFSTFLFPKLKH